MDEVRVNPWDAEELGHLLRPGPAPIDPHDEPDPYRYLLALNWQRMRAVLHANKVESAREAFWQDWRSKRMPLGSEDWKQAMWEIAAEATACVQSLHTMEDSLAQLIDALIWPGEHDEDRIKPGIVARKLGREYPESGILKRMQALRESEEFRYIDAFCNKTKHVDPINTRHYMERMLGPELTVAEGIGFSDFSRFGQFYPSLSVDILCSEYRKKVFELVQAVLDEIASWLKGQSTG